MVVRHGLHARGLRFRLHCKTLPGCPDLVFARHQAVIFVHGCFWYGHQCATFTWPETRREFWRDKIGKNRERDQRVHAALKREGWQVLTVWECALRGRGRCALDDVLNCCEAFLRNGTHDEMVIAGGACAGRGPGAGGREPARAAKGVSAEAWWAAAAGAAGAEVCRPLVRSRGPRARHATRGGRGRPASRRRSDARRVFGAREGCRRRRVAVERSRAAVPALTWSWSSPAPARRMTGDEDGGEVCANRVVRLSPDWWCDRPLGPGGATGQPAPWSTARWPRQSGSCWTGISAAPGSAGRCAAG